jgi:hypothetical protein
LQQEKKEKCLQSLFASAVAELAAIHTMDCAQNAGEKLLPAKNGIAPGKQSEER